MTLAVLAGSINPLGEELNDSRFEVVHRACNLYAPGGFEIPQHRAPLPKVGDSHNNVLSGYGVYERVVLGGALPVY